jgi:hypothetical protein
MRVALLVYLAGVVVGVSVGDAAVTGRVALALVWPLGVAAFVVTIAVLLAASLILFPAVGAAVAGVALLWWILG